MMELALGKQAVGLAEGSGCHASTMMLFPSSADEAAGTFVAIHDSA